MGGFKKDDKAVKRALQIQEIERARIKKEREDLEVKEAAERRARRSAGSRTRVGVGLTPAQPTGLADILPRF